MRAQRGSLGTDEGTKRHFGDTGGHNVAPRGHKVALWGQMRAQSDTLGTQVGTKRHFGDRGWHFGAQEDRKWHFGDIKWHFGDTGGHRVALWGQMRAQRGTLGT